jgi:branched-chain amino acid transport system substrate-binding protein
MLQREAPVMPRAAGVAALVGLMWFTAGARAEIVIGTAGPMSGPFAIFGAQMMAGAEQAVADINAAGGVLGETLVLEVADDRCDRKQAESVANQMVGRGIALMVGHLCSGASTVAAAIYTEAGIVQISPGAREPAYTDERAGIGTFRLAGRADGQGRVAGEFLAEKFADRQIAVIHDGSPYGQALADATRLAMNDAGKAEAFAEAYPANERDYAPLMARLVADAVDVLFFGGYHTEAGLIVRRMREEGLETILVSGDALMTEEFLAIAGDAGEGSLMTYPPDPARNADAAAVVEELAAKGIVAEGYILHAYAAVEAWAEAVNAAGTRDFAAVARALADGTFATVLGSVEFDDKGDATLPAYVIYQWRGGKYAPM